MPRPPGVSEGGRDPPVSASDGQIPTQRPHPRGQEHRGQPREQRTGGVRTAHGRTRPPRRPRLHPSRRAARTSCSTPPAPRSTSSCRAPRHREIRFILSHGGGFLPCTAHRFALALQTHQQVSGVQPVMDHETILTELRRFHFDTALSANPDTSPPCSPSPTPPASPSAATSHTRAPRCPPTSHSSSTRTPSTPSSAQPSTTATQRLSPHASPTDRQASGRGTGSPVGHQVQRERGGTPECRIRAPTA